MAACLRGKKHILLGPKIKLFLLTFSLSLAFTHSENQTGRKELTQLVKNLGLSQNEETFQRVKQVFRMEKSQLLN